MSTSFSCNTGEQVLWRRRMQLCHVSTSTGSNVMALKGDRTRYCSSVLGVEGLLVSICSLRRRAPCSRAIARLCDGLPVRVVLPHIGAPLVRSHQVSSRSGRRQTSQPQLLRGRHSGASPVPACITVEREGSRTERAEAP
jgi:hypothetical protein